MFDEKELKWFALKQGGMEFRFFLKKPNGETIQELHHLENKRISYRINGLHELSFEIPYQVLNEKEESIINPYLELFKSRYLVEVKNGRGKELFIILTTDKVVDEDKNRVKFTLQSYARQMAKDIVYEYEGVSKTLAQHFAGMTEGLETAWKVGYVDTEIGEKKRGFEVKNQTLLEAVIELAKVYNAMPEWDGYKKEIDFLNPARMGKDRGLIIEEEKYLKSLDLTIEAEEVISRLHMYGKDGISIREHSPTGQTFIENYAWYMHPFKMDNNGNVLESSYYMSDGLCKALIRYQEVVADNDGKFGEILKQEEELYDKLFKAELERSNAKAELKKVTDKLDILNSNKQHHTNPEQAQAEIDEVITEKEEKEEVYSQAQQKLEEIADEIFIVDEEKTELQNLLSKEHYFSREQILELDNFTVSKIFQDDSIEDPEDLLELGKEVFEKYSQPKITANVDIINFLNIMEYYGDWDKIQLGDRIRLKHEGMGINVKVQIMSIDFDISGNSISLEIANEHEADDEFLKELHDSFSSSTIVDMDRYKWDLAEDANDNISKILNNVWDTTKNAIEGGVEQSVSISERGIVIRATEDPDRLLVAQNGVLALSRDGGNNWYTAITPDGVFAERLVGRVLLGNKLVIEDESGIIEIVGSTQNVYDENGDLKVQLGELDDDKGYGMKIDGGALHIIGEVDEENLSPEFIESIMYDDKPLREDLRLESPLPTNLVLDKAGVTAYTEYAEDEFARLDYRGLYIQGGAIDIRTKKADNEGITLTANGLSGYNVDNERTFFLDNNGNFHAKTGKFSGELEAAKGTFTGELVAADGTFTGQLNGVDGTFVGKLQGNIIEGGEIIGGSISGTTLNINDNFIVDRFGNLTAREGTFAGTIATEQDAIVGKRLYLNAIADDGGIVLNYQEPLNGQIYYDNKRDEDGSSLARMILQGRIVQLRGTIGGTELLSANGRTIISSTGARNPNLEFWRHEQGEYLGRFYVDNVGAFRISTESGAQISVSNHDKDGVEILTNQGGYARILASEFINSSDKTLKKNISKSSYSALEMINNTTIYDYNYRDDEEYTKKRTGVIFQEAPKEIHSSNGSKAIDLYSMTTVAWKSIQEMSLKINKLEQEVRELKGEKNKWS